MVQPPQMTSMAVPNDKNHYYDGLLSYSFRPLISRTTSIAWEDRTVASVCNDDGSLRHICR